MSDYKPVSIARPDHISKQQPWGFETLLMETADYSFKQLLYRPGEGGNLQMHTRKTETFHIVQGEGLLTYDNGNGDLVEVRCGPGETVHVPAGAAHKFVAVRGEVPCIVFEASQPVKDDRVRLEKYFGLPEDPSGLPSTGPEPTR